LSDDEAEDTICLFTEEPDGEESSVRLPSSLTTPARVETRMTTPELPDGVVGHDPFGEESYSFHRKQAPLPQGANATGTG